LEVVRAEYLAAFVPEGGAAVKFVVPTTTRDAFEVSDGLRVAAEELGLQFIKVDGTETKLHLADRLFGAVARQVDWDALAATFVRQLLTQRGLRLPPPESQANHPLDIAVIAGLNDATEPLLRADLRRAVENEIFRDYAMTQGFRLAMIRLCLAQLDPDEDPALRAAILEWLRGELRLVSSVKRALIFQKVGRHTGLDMLLSLLHWLRRAARRGSLIVLDISRYGQAVRRPDREDGLYYSTPATLDLYELLRQLIDAIDGLESCFVAVLAGTEFLLDDRRGLRSYQALYFRVADDVHDRFRENPLAPLVRLGGGQ
jgi:hypothetical protein